VADLAEDALFRVAVHQVQVFEKVATTPSLSLDLDIQMPSLAILSITISQNAEFALQDSAYLSSIHIAK